MSTKYTIKGYLIGNVVRPNKALSFDLFDSVHVIRKSKKYYHAIGYRGLEATILILEEK